MIHNPRELWKFEKRLIASQPADFRANLRLADAMVRWARKLGKFPGRDLLDGVEIHIRMAKVFGRVRRTP